MEYDIPKERVQEQETTTTFDNEFATGKDLAEYYEKKIWNHRYADVAPIEEIIDHIMK